MKTIFHYFLEANGYLLVFLAFYLLVLKNETQFRLKRAFLLLALVVSLVFPWISVESSASPAIFQSISQAAQTNWLPEIEVIAGGKASGWEWIHSIDLWKVAKWVYLAGFLGFSLIFLSQLSHLVRLMRQTKSYPWNNCRVVESEEETETFSFFNFIFIGHTSVLTPQEKLQILRHEQIHASQWHSIDILLSNVLSILFWFNPFIKTYKKILIQLHEFEADARAVENMEVNEYCNLLARVALQSAGISLANHFNQSLTIKRISMMKTMKKKMNGWKMAGLIVLFPAAFFILSCQKQGLEEVQKADNKPAAAFEAKKADGKGASTFGAKEQVYTVVEQMPEFPGGVPEMMKFLADNIRYPEESKKRGIEGTVFVSFIIDKNGKVTHEEIVKGVDAALDKEALRVVSVSPAWIPGKQNGKTVNLKFTLPIKFSLGN